MTAEYITYKQLIEELRVTLRDLDQRIDQSVSAHWDAHDREHKALSDSIVVARVAMEGRLERLNELRAEVITDRGEFIRRDTFDSFKEVVSEHFGALDRAKAAIPMAAVSLIVSGVAAVVAVVIKS